MAPEGNCCGGYLGPSWPANPVLTCTRRVSGFTGLFALAFPGSSLFPPRRPVVGLEVCGTWCCVLPTPAVSSATHYEGGRTRHAGVIGAGEHQTEC